MSSRDLAASRMSNRNGGSRDALAPSRSTPRGSQRNLAAAAATTSQTQLASQSHQLTPDLLFKMSKKIAQLTKVIYVLNTQNEDLSRELEVVQWKGARDVEEILEESAKKLDVYKELLEEEHKARQEVIDASLEEATSKFQETQQLWEMEKEQLQEEAQERETKLKSQMMEMSKDVQQIKADFVSRLATFHKRVNEMQSEKAALVQAKEQQTSTLEEKLTRQEQVYTDSVDKYQSLLADAEAQQSEMEMKLEQLGSKYEQDAEKARSEVEQLQTELTVARKKAEDSLRERTDQLDQAERENEQLSAELDLAKKELDEKREALELTMAEKAKYQELLEESTQQLLASEMTRRKSQEDLEQKQVAVQDLQSQSAFIQTQLEKTKTDSGKLQENLHQLTEQQKFLKNLLSQSEKKAAESSEECKKLKGELDKVKADYSAKDKLAFSLKVKLEEQIKDDAKKLKSELERTNQEHATIVQGHLQTIHSANAEISRHTTTIQQLTSLKQQHEVTIQQLHASIQDLQKELKDTEPAMNALRDEIQQLNYDKEDLYQHILDTKDKIAQECMAKYRSDTAQREKEMKAQLEADVERMRKQLVGESSQTVQELEASLKHTYEERMAQMKESHRQKQVQFDLEYNDVKNSLTYAMESMEKQRVAMDQLGQNHERSLKAMQEQHSEELVRLRQELTQLADVKLRERDGEHQAELARVKKEMSAHALESKRHLQVAFDELTVEHERYLLNGKKELEQQLEAELGQQAKGYEIQLERLRQVSELAAASAKKKLTEEVAKAIKETEARCGEVIKAKEAAIEEWKVSLAEKETDILETQERMVALKRKMENYDAVFAAHTNEIAHTREVMRQSLVKLESELTAKHQRQVELKQQEFIKQTQKMLQDFESARSYYEEQLKEKERLIAEANQLYANRKPREEDVQRIHELEEEGRRKLRKMKAMQEEMDFIRLELQNREDNLNRMFNTKPQVGLLQALTPASKQQRNLSPATFQTLRKKLPPVQQPPSSFPRKAASNPNIAPPKNIQ